MFCSNCGKTLKAEMVKCPHCGAVIGESRFEGHPYTGAQARIRPGEAVRLPGNHTRTTYMGSDSSMEGDVETRTTYRATNEGAAPEYAMPEPTPEPLFNAEGEELEDMEETLLPEAEADYLTPETAADVPETEASPSRADSGEEDEEEDIDIDREDLEEEERQRAARKAERKARREARRAERRRLEELEDEELGEPIEEDEEEAQPRRARRQRAKEETEESAELMELKAREIEEIRPAGFSEDIHRYMNERRSEYEEKNQSAQAKAEKKKKRGLFSWKKKPTEDDDFEEDFDEENDQTENFDAAPKTFVSPAETFVAADQQENGDPTPEEELDAGEYVAEEEAQYVSDDDELVFTSENPDVGDDFSDVDLTFDDEADFIDEETLARRQKVFRLLKYVVAAGIVVALIVGVTTLLSNIARDTQKTQIPNVSTVLFEQGVELMQSRVGDDYIKQRLDQYDRTNTGSLVAVSEALTGDLDSLDKLLPENPDLNDQRFINALKAIQEDINNCLTNDILSLSDSTKTNEVKQSESDARWTIVREKVEALSKATDKSQLDAIIKGERIEVIRQATPEPEPTNTPEPYVKLSKGSKGDAVVKLQTRLTSLGYMSSEIDGDYGNKTKTAVQLFQKEAGLETTGIADAQTQERLYAPDAPMKSN